MIPNLSASLVLYFLLSATKMALGYLLFSFAGATQSAKFGLYL